MSPAIRMYFPLTPAQVGQLHTDWCLDAGLVGFAVDDGVRASVVDGDDELWEFLTLQRAAAHAQNFGGPVVVAAADVPEHSQISSAGAEALATLNQPLVLTQVACLHLGDDALGVGALGESSALVSGEHIDLSWFDVSEMAQVVRHLSSPQ